MSDSFSDSDSDEEKEGRWNLTEQEKSESLVRRLKDRCYHHQFSIALELFSCDCGLVGLECKMQNLTKVIYLYFVPWIYCQYFCCCCYC